MLLGSFIYFRWEAIMAGAIGTHGIPDILISSNHRTLLHAEEQ